MPDTLRYGLPLLIALLIALFVADAWLHLLPRPTLQERRKPAAWPAWQAGNPDAYVRGLERYFNDHFTWRNALVHTSSRLNYRLFGKSPLPDKVVIGKNGWLFKGGVQLDIYRGRFRFTPLQLEQIRRELEWRRDSVAARGGRYYLSLAPLKARLYSEYLPDHVRPLNAENAADQLVRYLREHSDIDYIDLFSPLQKWKAEHPDTLLFLTTDHHWTPVAGLVAADVILRHLRRDFPKLDTLRRHDYYFTYDTLPGLTLAEMLGLERELTERLPVLHPRSDWQAKAVPRPDYTPPAGFAFPDQYLMECRTGRGDLPSLFVTRESFAGFLILPLSEHFYRSIYLFDEWRHDFNGDIYAREGGDIYLQLIWEGMIYQLLEEGTEDYGW